MVQITKDNAYDAVAADDFPAMLETGRYGNRSTAFDKIISATHDHFWDPLDKKYIDFTEPYDMWTSRAPAEFKDRVPHVEDVEGQPTWIVDGTSLGLARA